MAWGGAGHAAINQAFCRAALPGGACGAVGDPCRTRACCLAQYIRGVGLLRGYIRDLRAVLGDDAAAPRFIETMPRRGYRFIASISRQESATHSLQAERGDQPQGVLRHPSAGMVGREAEQGQLRGTLEKAERGERQVVFVTGEPGIGKTTLVEAFLAQAAATGKVWVGRGQCVEHYGAGEASSADAGSAGTALSAPGRGASHRTPESVCTDLAGTAACAHRRSRAGSAPAQGAGRATGADAGEMAEAVEALEQRALWCWRWKTCNGAIIPR